MTTVNDIADIVRIIREQPEWADTIRGILLSRELLELPQKFAEYTEASNRRSERLENALAEFVASTNRRLESLETQQAEMKSDISELKTDVAENRRRRAENRRRRAENRRRRAENRHDSRPRGPAPA